MLLRRESLEPPMSQVVTTGKSRSEQMFSGLLPKADSDLRIKHVPASRKID